MHILPCKGSTIFAHLKGKTTKSFCSGMLKVWFFCSEMMEISLQKYRRKLLCLASGHGASANAAR